MFRSPRTLSPEPSRAELAGTITTADKISVDCTKYGCSRVCCAVLNITISEMSLVRNALLAAVREESFARIPIFNSPATSLRNRVLNPSSQTCRNLESSALDRPVNFLRSLAVRHTHYSVRNVRTKSFK